MYRLRLDKLCGRVGLEVLHDTLRNENQRDDEADRQQNPQERARKIDPEISNCLHFAACDSANDRNRECDSDRSGREVVVREPSHLREIAHRRFRHVGLPVRVCGERCRGAPCEIGRDVGELLRIESEEVLRALDHVEQDHRGGAEEQHRGAIFDPAHFAIFVNTTNSIDELLDWT